MSEARFEKQVAIVTGGCSGLGKAIAERLAREQASVVIFDTNQKALEAAEAGYSEENLRIYGKAVDVTDESQVAAAIQAVAKKHGKLDVMVNAAGIVGPNNMKTTEVPLEGFQKTLQVNITGSFLMLKHSLLAMLPQNYGRILLIASISGKDGNAGMVPYSTSKAAVMGLVKAAGKEYAETGITINGIAPAVIRTPIHDNMSPDQIKYMTDKIPMKRCGTLDEFAAIGTWIVSREASFNTAFVFDLSGGRAVY